MRSLLILTISLSSNTAFANEVIRITPEYKGSSGPGGLNRIYSQGASNPNGTVQGMLYVEDGGQSSRTLRGVFSKDSGKTWTAPIFFSNSTGVYNFSLNINESGAEITAIWVEGGQRQDLVMRQSFDGGINWLPRKLIGSSGAYASAWGLSVKQNSTGSAKIVGFGNRDNNSQLLVATTTDRGLTWNLNSSSNSNLKQYYWDVGVSESGINFAYTYEDYGTPELQGQLFFSSSQDGGKTWQPEKILSTTSRFSPGSEIISLDSEKFIIANHEGPELLISTDLGRTFTKENFPVSGAFSVSAALDITRGSIYATFITATGPGRNIYFSRTDDDGKSWTKPILFSNSGDNYPQLLWSQSEDRIAIIWHEWGGKQINFTVSGDQGKSWSKSASLLNEGNGVAGSGVDSAELFAHLSASDQYFVGWTNLDTTGNYSLQAKYINIVTLRFNSNGATLGTPPNFQTLILGQSADIPRYSNEFSKTHHEFVNWNTNSDGTGSMVYSGLGSLTIIQNTEIYATWKELPKFEISFDSNRILKSTPPSQTFYIDEFATIPLIDSSLVRGDRIFRGWNTSPDGKGKSFSADIGKFTLKSPLRLFAIGVKKPLTKELICVRGKLVKKVIGLKPVCPSGYKKR
jgi:hypothetical protein